MSLAETLRQVGAQTTKQRQTPLSYATPHWAAPDLIELRHTPSELHKSLVLSYATPPRYV